MSGFEDAYAAVRSELAATPSKRVLLVEGTGDVEFLTFLLDKEPLRTLNAHAGWVFGAAGGKESVMRMLARERNWIGLVDRDAWSEQEIREAMAKTPNLRLLPRYCIENYLVEPAALEQMANQVQQAEKRQRLLKQIEEMQRQWPHAIRHASIWRAVQPLQNALQALGFNGALLRFKLPGDEAVREVLHGWSELMDEERIFTAYQRYQAEGNAMPIDQAQRLWVHGKMFWRHVVAPALTEVLDEPNEGRLRRLVLRRMPLPQDMQEVLEQVFAAH